MYGKKDGAGGSLFVCALACGAEKWYDNYLRNVREVILYEIRYRYKLTFLCIFMYLYKSPQIVVI